MLECRFYKRLCLVSEEKEKINVFSLIAHTYVGAPSQTAASPSLPGLNPFSVRFVAGRLRLFKDMAFPKKSFKEETGVKVKTDD